MAHIEEVFKKLVSHCKEYGFIYPSSEIYDGLSAVYDYGPYGVELKNNIKTYWWKSMVQLNDNIVGLDSAIFMHPTTWKASGHVDAFNDPLVDCKNCKARYRADKVWTVTAKEGDNVLPNVGAEPEADDADAGDGNDRASLPVAERCVHACVLTMRCRPPQ